MPEFRVPAGLASEARWIAGEQGARWAERLPTTVDRLSEQWRFEVGEPYDSCHVSLTMPVTLADGRSAVCKVPMSDADFRFAPGAARHGEPRALRWWNGTASVQLFAYDEPSGAMLLERCRPGTALADGVAPETADEIAADLLRRLHDPPPSDVTFLRLSDMAAHLAAVSSKRYDETGRPFERALLDEALEILRTAPVAPDDEVLLHGDTHHANILAAGTAALARHRPAADGRGSGVRRGAVPAVPQGRPRRSRDPVAAGRAPLLRTGRPVRASRARLDLRQADRRRARQPQRRDAPGEA